MLVLQHGNEPSSGVLQDVLQARGLDSVVVRVDRCDQLPDPKRLGLAVVVGLERFPGHRAEEWVDAELDWLRRADRGGTAVLALGSGAQALAVALGGGVQRAQPSRHGWLRITTTEQSALER